MPIIGIEPKGIIAKVWNKSLDLPSLNKSSDLLSMNKYLHLESLNKASELSSMNKPLLLTMNKFWTF